jgi:hypothetical protein
MNRTIRNLVTGAATLLSLGLAGCTDPTVGPVSTVTEDNIFNDPNAYLAFLAKIYAGLSTTGQRGPAGDKDIQVINDEGFSQYMRLYWEHQELPTDEAALAWGDGAVQEFNGQVWGSSNSFLSAMFARVYLQVGWANEFLKQTTDAKLAERGVAAPLRVQIQRYRAEARFLRALSYWHGLDLFGPIPLVTANDPTPPQQATRQQIYDFIVNELIAIQPDLPAAGAGTYGRATKEAASMVLAKVYLNAEVYTGTPHYDLALTAAQAVIAGPFTLDPVYRHLFQADNNTSPEIIFPVVQDGLHTRSYGGTTFLIHASCGGGTSDPFYQDPALYGVDGCWYGLRLKPQAYNLSAGDPRASYFFTTGRTPPITSLTNFGEGIAAPKFTNLTSTGARGSDAGFPDTDFPMFRLADAYLIYAEATLRPGGGGSTAQALTYFNQIRERAYGNTSANITLAQLTLDTLLAERGRELLWEAHRRTDLIRYGLFTGSGYIWSWKGNVQTGQATLAHLNLYPIPASQLSANPNLKQNPGY